LPHPGDVNQQGLFRLKARVARGCDASFAAILFLGFKYLAQARRVLLPATTPTKLGHSPGASGSDPADIEDHPKRRPIGDWTSTNHDTLAEASKLHIPGGVHLGGTTVAQISKSAVSPVSKPASRADPPRPADLEIRDTAGWETCATTTRFRPVVVSARWALLGFLEWQISLRLILAAQV
jgi:hypothetical protein